MGVETWLGVVILQSVPCGPSLPDARRWRLERKPCRHFRLGDKIFYILSRQDGPAHIVDRDAIEPFDDQAGMIVSGLISLGLAILRRSSATDRRLPTPSSGGPRSPKAPAGIPEIGVL
jgi:hypothetical protein